MTVGLSTGAVAPGDPHTGLDVAGSFGVGAVELSALHTDELADVLAELASARRRFGRVAVHAPAKGRAATTGEIAALADLDVDVIVHPDVVSDWAPWRRLGRRLLIENTDGRKACGQHADDLSRTLDRLPGARVCLDVSHALHAGGPALLCGLVSDLGGRVGHVHVGCGCGGPTADRLEADLLDTLADTVDRLAARDLVVVLERPATVDDTAAQLLQLYGHLGCRPAADLQR